MQREAPQRLCGVGIGPPLGPRPSPFFGRRKGLLLSEAFQSESRGRPGGSHEGRDAMSSAPEAGRAPTQGTAGCHPLWTPATGAASLFLSPHSVTVT